MKFKEAKVGDRFTALKSIKTFVFKDQNGLMKIPIVKTHPDDHYRNTVNVNTGEFYWIDPSREVKLV